MSVEQLKQGLLIHFEANKNFIEEKVYKEFAQQCIKEHDIMTLNVSKMKQVIKFTFDFGGNTQMKPFFDRIDKNINEFIKAEKTTKQPNKKGNVPIDLENLTNLILFCINNGFEKPAPKPKPEPVKLEEKPVEEKKKVIPPPPVKKQEPEEPKKQEKKKPQITLLNPELQAKVDKIKLISKPIEPIKAPAKVSTRLEPDKIPPKVEFKIEKYEMPKVVNVTPRYLQTIETKVKEPEPQVKYEPIDPEFAKNEYNRRMMRERLFDLYKHYCSQQQNKGHSATFDKIKSEMEHMTMGKFLLFCKSSGIFGDLKLMTKETLMNGYKKVAGGKPEIDFEIFEGLIKELDSKYLSALQKCGKSSLATYEARLKLNSNQGYKELKKSLNMIFFTRDSKNKEKKMFVSNFDQRDLTGHSGKFENDLQQELANKIRHSQTIEAINQTNRNQANDKDSKSRYKALSIEQIGNKKWPKIDWLQQQFKIQQTIQQDSLPKIARRKDVVANLKKRVQQVSKMQNHK